MDKKDTIETMDELVRRVTVVRGSGENRQAEVVYESEADHSDDEDKPNFEGLEQSIRHLLKAQLIAAQEAYQRHIESAEKGGTAWIKEAPSNFMKAGKKAVKEAKKSMPFAWSKSDENEDEDEAEDKKGV
jgi:hypothetical protein